MRAHLCAFQILVFLLPTQLALHFWPPWAFIFGIRVDYLAPTIYLTDLLILLILVLWAPQYVRENRLVLLARWRWATVFLGLVLFNIFFAKTPVVAALAWVKFGQLTLLAFYVYQNRSQIVSLITTPLALSLVFTALIALGQLVLQRTIGGPLYFLGERTFSAATPGIALFNFFGKSLMRPYATFPHPNVMGGYALVATAILLFGRVRTKHVLLGMLAGVWIIIISYSQNVWAVGVLLLVVYAFGERINFKRIYKVLIILLFVLSVSLPRLANTTFAKEFSLSQSVVQRLELYKIAGRVFSSSPIFGVGLNGFIGELPSFQNRIAWFLQPVHNIYLLIMAEVGIVGLLLFYILLYKAVAGKSTKRAKIFMVPIVAILLTGYWDHYWLTIQQTQILFGISVACNTACYKP